MPTDPNIIGSVLSTLGIGGALVWYLYYTTSVTMPKRDDHYSQTLNEITKEFTTCLKEERDYRRTEIIELKAVIRESRCLFTLPEKQNQRVQQESESTRNEP